MQKHGLIRSNWLSQEFWFFSNSDQDLHIFINFITTVLSLYNVFNCNFGTSKIKFFADYVSTNLFIYLLIYFWGVKLIRERNCIKSGRPLRFLKNNPFNEADDRCYDVTSPSQVNNKATHNLNTFLLFSLPSLSHLKLTPLKEVVPTPWIKHGIRDPSHTNPLTTHAKPRLWHCPCQQYHVYVYRPCIDDIDQFFLHFQQ